MKQIHLYNEISGTTTSTKVTEKQFKILDNLVYSKGYKLFGLSLTIISKDASQQTKLL